MADAYLTFDTKLNTAGFKSGLGQVTGMFTKLAALAGVAFSVGAVVAFGKAAVQAAGQAEAKFKGLEFLMKANGRSMSEATSFIKEFTADGLVPMTSAYESYKNMVSRGYSTEQIEKMLKVMKDAAVYNRQGQFSMGEAMEKATMGLRMENSLLTDSVGIQKNVAKMWQEYAKSIGTTAGNLTMLQKRQAEFEGFMAEGGVFAGAAAEYANSYAGKVATISAAFKELQISVGNAIIPFINALLPAITKAILWFTRLFNIVGQVVNLLFGTNVGMADAEAAIAGSAEQTAAATGETAANTEAAGKAAKGALASFDKLNVLAQDTSSGGGGGGGGGVGGLIPPSDEQGGMSDNLDELSGKIKTFTETVRRFFATMKSEGWKAAFSELFNVPIGKNNFFTILGGFIDDVALAVGQFKSNVEKWGLKKAIQFELDPRNWFTAEGENNLIENFLNTSGAAFDGFKERIKTMGLKAAIEFELDPKNWFTSTGGGLPKLYEDYIATPFSLTTQAIKTGDWSKMNSWFETDVLQPIGKAFGITWEGPNGVEGGVARAVQSIKKGDWSIFSDWFQTNVLTPTLSKIGLSWEGEGGVKEKINGVFTDVKTVWNEAPTWFETQWTNIKTTVDTKWDGVKTSINQAWTDVKASDAWGDVETWFSNAWVNVKSTVDTKWGEIGSFITGIWDGTDGIKAKWNEAATWFDTTIWTPIKTKAGEIWTAISTGASSIGVNIANSVVDAVNGVIGFINSMINGLEDAINGLINLVNTLPLLNIPTIDLPNIKLLDPVTGGGGEIPNWWGLASGAVIPPNAPFMAVMGDQRRGTNLEAPESLIRQIVREEAGNAGGQNITITFGGTMGELVRQLKPHIERETNRAGGSMLAKAVRA